MNELAYGFFVLSTLFVLVGGLITVAATNPIRGAMGLLTSILGIAGMYLLLSAEFLAVVQVLVYAGAVVVLFLFIIMLLGPTAIVANDPTTRVSRFFGAGIFLACFVAALVLLAQATAVSQVAVSSRGAVGAHGPESAALSFPIAPVALGTIEGLGRELFTTYLLPFELSAALLLVAVIGAIAVARGKQPDPTLATRRGVAQDPPRREESRS